MQTLEVGSLSLDEPILDAALFTHCLLMMLVNDEMTLILFQYLSYFRFNSGCRFYIMLFISFATPCNWTNFNITSLFSKKRKI
jgi:hypothetical protein